MINVFEIVSKNRDEAISLLKQRNNAYNFLSTDINEEEEETYEDFKKRLDDKVILFDEEKLIPYILLESGDESPKEFAVIKVRTRKNSSGSDIVEFLAYKPNYGADLWDDGYLAWVIDDECKYLSQAFVYDAIAENINAFND